jgi:HAMP domain-containing protein
MRLFRSASLTLRVAAALVGVALLSVLLLGIYNYVQARLLLNDAIDDQLMSLAAARTQAIDIGLEGIQGEVAAIAQDRAVEEALEDLDAGHAALGGSRLTPSQRAELERFYDETVIAGFSAAGLDPPAIDEVVPVTPSGRYLQYHYLVAPQATGVQGRDLERARDDSAYSAAHRRHHDFLRGLADAVRSPDLLLISARDLSVVYSVEKRVDFGTSLVSGPHADTELAEVVLDKLATARVGEGVFVDFEPYVPAGGRPVMFLAAAVRSETAVIGAVVIQLEGSSLTRLTTADGNFEDLGLGDTGETYVVGKDKLMRSDSRLFIEDQERYLATVRKDGDDERASLMETFGTTAFLQPVDNEAVDSALDGQEFFGTTRSYLGQETLTSASPIGADDLGWVLVAEVATREADNALNDYLVRVLLVALFLIPIVAVVAIVLARSLTRPIDPLIDAAVEVAAGDVGVTLPDLGRNEIGDLARQLNGVTAELRVQEDALGEEERRISELLNATLPPWLADALRDPEADPDDLVDSATIVSMSIDGLPDPGDGDPEGVFELTTAIAEATEAAAREHGLERLRATPANSLYVAGLGAASSEADSALRFVASAVAAIGGLRSPEADLRVRAGLSAGDVAIGVVGHKQAAVGLWGDSAGAALTLDTLAAPGQILIDASAAAALTERWQLSEVELEGLAESDLSAFEVEITAGAASA